MDWYPFRSILMSTRIPIYSYLKIWLWKSKVKVMGEVTVENHNMAPTFYRLRSLSFHVNRLSHSWDTNFQNLTMKIQGQGHSLSPQSRFNTLSTHIPFIPCRSALPFLGYSYFKIWHWNFKVKVMGEIQSWKSQHGPNIQSDSYPFRSMSIGHPIPELWLFAKFDLENKGSRSWVRSQSKVTMWVSDTVKTFWLLLDQGGILAWFCWY